MNSEELSKFIRKFFSHSLTDDIKNRFGQWLISENSSDLKMKAMEEIWLDDSSCIKATDETLKDLDSIHLRMNGLLPKRSFIPYFLRVAAAVVLFVTGSLCTYFLLGVTDGKNQDVRMLQCFVPYGERKSVQLPDGSVAWLNAGSVLIYPEEFTGNVRSLYLSGKGEFTVVKNKKKPFIVRTNFIEVEALGTVFTVTSYPEDSITQTILEEGKVRVGIYNNHHENRILHPNELLTYSHKSEKITISNIDAEQSSKWKEGSLIFRAATLSEIFKSIERRHNVTIYYEKQKYVSGIYNIKFKPNETVNEDLKVLGKLVEGFDYKIEGNKIYIIIKKRR
jgi:ferric-dicitrate binding protein FerR (iron transport regulator)